MLGYDDLLSLVAGLGKTEFIGKTFLGYDIPLVRTERGATTLIVGSTHAREYITTYLTALLAEEGGVDVIPCLNIDGVLLVRLGENMFDSSFVSGQPAEVRSRLTEERLGFLKRLTNDFSLWKANLNGVDLNNNFDACFGRGVGNVTRPASHGYIGAYPESESETRAVAELVRSGRYDRVISYHSKGEEVYYGFGGDFSAETYAKKVAAYLGYNAKTTVGSCGGLKDYAVKKKLSKSLTIEVGSDTLKHPITEKYLSEIYEKHRGSIRIINE